MQYHDSGAERGTGGVTDLKGSLRVGETKDIIRNKGIGMRCKNRRKGIGNRINREEGRSLNLPNGRGRS